VHKERRMRRKQMNKRAGRVEEVIRSIKEGSEQRIEVEEYGGVEVQEDRVESWLAESVVPLHSPVAAAPPSEWSICRVGRG
jgi:hypothetical protein